MPHPLPCQGCPYDGTGGAFVPPDPLQPWTRLHLWGEAPGHEETRAGRGFAGRSGRLERQLLTMAGFRTWSAWPGDQPEPNDEVACANVVLCHPPSNDFPGPEIARECLRRHNHGPEPNRAKSLSDRVPTLIAGANAAEALTGFRLSPLNTRGSLLPLRAGGWATYTLHPAFLLHASEDEAHGKSLDSWRPLLARDARRAVEAQVPEVPTIKLAERPPEGLTPPSPVAVDVEGRDGVPTIVGFSWREDGGVQRTLVVPWSSDAASFLRRLDRHVLIYHNASFDLTELAEVDVDPPASWIDTINLAALYDPGARLRLESQVLTHVTGTVTWKGLVDHKRGYEYSAGNVAVYRRLWTETLTRLGRLVPRNPFEWYCFYNGLDTAWTLLLAEQLRARLQDQNRYTYYQTLMGPLQRPLYEMGRRGMPVDLDRLAHHRRACQRLQRMASAILRDAGEEMLREQRLGWLRIFRAGLRRRRQLYREAGKRVKFPGAADLSKARDKWRKAREHHRNGFSFDSVPQRRALLYERYGLPEVRDRKTKGPTTNEQAIESLLLRLTRRDPETDKPAPTVKPKTGTPDEVIRTLRAMLAGKKWAHWERAYLNPPVIESKELE